jgi:hypothetical protein
MADDRKYTESELAHARDIILGALAAAGSNGAGSRNWEFRVEAMVPHVAAMMEFSDWDHSSRMMRRALLCAEPDFVTGNFVSAVDEDKTGRMLVTFTNNRGEEESLRTEHTNTQAGANMKARLAQVAPGDRMLIRKVLEPMAGARGAMGQKARLMMHFEKLPPIKDAQDGAAPRSPSGEPPRGPDPGTPSLPGSTTQPGAGPALSSPAETSDYPDIMDRLHALGAKKMLAIKRQLEEQGKWPITHESVDAALLLIIPEEEG